MTEQATPQGETSPEAKASSLISGSQPLPKIVFICTVGGKPIDTAFKIIDRHGLDVSDLFSLKRIGFEMDLGPWGHGRLCFLARGWTVDCGPNELVNNAQIMHESGYNLMDGFEPNTIQENFPGDGGRQIEITFDAEWGG